MTFDAGTWWLITIIVTTVVGLVGFLFGRSVFRQLDENRADIKQVRENYTPRDDHQKDLERLRTAHQKDVEALRREMKEMRTEMRTEIRRRLCLRCLMPNRTRRSATILSSFRSIFPTASSSLRRTTWKTFRARLPTEWR